MKLKFKGDLMAKTIREMIEVMEHFDNGGEVECVEREVVMIGE